MRRSGVKISASALPWGGVEERLWVRSDAPPPPPSPVTPNFCLTGTPGGVKPVDD